MIAVLFLDVVEGTLHFTGHVLHLRFSLIKLGMFFVIIIISKFFVIRVDDQCDLFMLQQVGASSRVLQSVWLPLPPVAPFPVGEWS